MIKFVQTALIKALPIIIGCSMLKKNPPKMKPEMILVEGGSFSISKVTNTTNSDAFPVHEVNVGDYYIGKFEVNFQQYDEFALKTERPLPNDISYMILKKVH